jgi:hypothetical protein
MQRLHKSTVLLLSIGFAFAAAQVFADEGGYFVDGLRFESRSHYLNSDYFRDMGRRCGTPSLEDLAGQIGIDILQSDCTLSSTAINPVYDPGEVYEIPVVVHVISTTTGVGDITNAQVESQIDILNEDYMALPGTPGAPGTVTAIQFRLEAINRVANNSYFNCSYPCTAVKSALSWDTNIYLNVYTNLGAGLLGWATLPQQSAGAADDGVVCAWDAFGRNSPAVPYNQGRTATHEIGHWLGLLHPFQSGCGVATPPGCYSSADLICDTNPDFPEHYNCVPTTSCGAYQVPIENYMEYTNDTCMDNFTPEQMNRMRCSMVTYRPDVYEVVTGDEIFSDGFESGDISAWD